MSWTDKYDSESGRREKGQSLDSVFGSLIPDDKRSLRAMVQA